MYNIKLKPGSIVKIYTDYKNDLKYEGLARLIKFDKYGDSFYEDFEEIYVDNNIKSSLKTKLSVRQLESNNRYDNLIKFFESMNPVIRSFKEEMRKACNKKITSYDKMMEVYYKYKGIAQNNRTSSLNILFDLVDHVTLIRFFQQRYIKDWKPTLFISERWLVEFLPQYDEENNILFYSEFRTYRYIKKVSKICPSEEAKTDDLVRFTTYNGKNQNVVFDEDDDEPDIYYFNQELIENNDFL